MLVSAIVTEIITDVGGDTSDTDLTSRVLGYMKSSLRRLPDYYRDKSLKRVSSLSLASGDQTVSLPSGFLSEVAVWREYQNRRQHITIQKDRQHFNDRYRTDSSGAPEHVYLYASTMEFDKTADQAYTIYLENFYEIDDIDSGDTFAHNSSIAEIIKDGAKAYYYDYTEEETRATKWMKIFIGGLDKLDAKYIREAIPDHVEEA